jgi:hypothetical protein
LAAEAVSAAAEAAGVVPVRGKLIGVILIVFSVALAVVPAVMLLPNLLNGTLKAGGFMICEGPAILLALLIAGAGMYFVISGKKEEQVSFEVEKEQKILNMIETRGKLRIADVAYELNITRDQAIAYIYDLVGKRLFTGYVDWQGGIIQSQEAKDIPQHKCPNCGGELELAGKGTVKCPYCGSEIFM